MEELICPECAAPMVLRHSKAFSKNGSLRPFYGCSRFPNCKATHGAHPNGKPLGVPANRETKQWRIKAHDVFDSLWKCSVISMTRKRAYEELAKKLGLLEVHIGEADIEMCKKIIKSSYELLKEYHPNMGDKSGIAKSPEIKN